MSRVTHKLLLEQKNKEVKPDKRNVLWLPNVWPYWWFRAIL